MDKLLKIKLFPLLDNKLSENEFKNLRILCVFGSKQSFIYVTNEDKVYGLGNNGNGCLGLGITNAFIKSPALNTTLSDKQLVDICFGCYHFIALTQSGQCYAWGNNTWGQLAIGLPNCHHSQNWTTPELIQTLADVRVVRISCGYSHNLALTDSGQVYAWGHNKFGQLGDQSNWDRFSPVLIDINDKVISVSAGGCHSIALTDTGRLYVWGINNKGQLGRVISIDGRVKDQSTRPIPLDSIALKSISKVVCGRDHTLLLTTDGDIYGFGSNESGQVGKGSEKTCLFTPVRVNGSIKFKDIVASNACDLSVGLSVQNKYYVWGLLCNQRKFFEPKEVRIQTSDNSSSYSLFDIYAIYAKYKITFRTILNFSEVNKPLSQSNCSMNGNRSGTTNGVEDMEPNDSRVSSMASNKTITYGDRPSVQTEKSSSVSTKRASNELLNCLNESFNNPNDYDIRFRFNDQYIFGHKTILRIRNQKFWQKCEQYMNEEKNEIRVKRYSYKSFLAFIQYLYTNCLDIEIESVGDLMGLANIYGEEGLKEKCGQLLANSIDSENVCKLYTKANEQNIQELEKYCLYFVSKHWKEICLTQDFRQMDEYLSKQLLLNAWSQ